MLAALVLLLTSAWAVPAQASSASCPSSTSCVAVTVVHDDGGPAAGTQYFTLSDLSAVSDQGLSGYRLRSARGLQDPLDVPAATSVRRLLQLDNLDPTAVTKIDVARTGSAGSVTLTGDPGDTQERGTAGYPFEGDNGDASRPLYPVLYTRGSGEINFIRPLRAGDGSDVNTTDSFGTDAGGVIAMTVHTTGTSITPVVTAGSKRAKVGQEVAFTATVGGTQPSGTYTWTYGGVSATETATTRHGWQKRGRYSVTVTVRTSDGSSGTSDPVIVQVGKKRPVPDATAPPGGAGPKKDGPADGPDDGAGNGPGDPSSSGGPRNQDGPGKTPGSTGPTSAATSPSRTSTPGKRTAAPATATGAQVSGVLLNAEQARQVITAQAPPSANVAAAAARRSGDVPRDWRWLLGGVPLLLLGAGVLRQTRWLVGRLPEPPWRQQ